MNHHDLEIAEKIRRENLVNEAHLRALGWLHLGAGLCWLFIGLNFLISIYPFHVESTENLRVKVEVLSSSLIVAGISLVLVWVGLGLFKARPAARRLIYWVLPFSLPVYSIFSLFGWSILQPVKGDPICVADYASVIAATPHIACPLSTRGKWVCGLAMGIVSAYAFATAGAFYFAVA